MSSVELSSVSTTATSSSSSTDSTLIKTGNELLEQDLWEVGLYFETELIEHDHEQHKLILNVMLPWWGPALRPKEILPVKAIIDYDQETYQFVLESENDLICEFVREAIQPRIMDSLRRIYVLLEAKSDSNDILIRDFYYEPFDPRHWGRTAPTDPINSVYPARALYPFNSVDGQELDLVKDEVITILANLGNGWLKGERMEGPAKGQRGLVPENYVERVEEEE